MKAPTLATRAAALAVLFAPVDGARAVWNGLVLIGHRSSVMAGRMIWAVPGGASRETPSLEVTDPAFCVIKAPSSYELQEQQPLLRSLTQKPTP